MNTVNFILLGILVALVFFGINKKTPTDTKSMGWFSATMLALLALVVSIVYIFIKG